MEKYIKRALELGKKEDDSNNIIAVSGNDEYLVVTLATPKQIENNVAMDLHRYAVNKKTGEEYFGIGYGFLFRDGFKNLKLDNLKQLNIESKKSA